MQSIKRMSGALLSGSIDLFKIINIYFKEENVLAVYEDKLIWEGSLFRNVRSNTCKKNITLRLLLSKGKLVVLHIFQLTSYVSH